MRVIYLFIYYENYTQSTVIIKRQKIHSSTLNCPLYFTAFIRGFSSSSGVFGNWCLIHCINRFPCYRSTFKRHALLSWSCWPSGLSMSMWWYWQCIWWGPVLNLLLLLSDKWRHHCRTWYTLNILAVNCPTLACVTLNCPCLSKVVAVSEWMCNCSSGVGQWMVTGRNVDVSWRADTRSHSTDTFNVAAGISQHLLFSWICLMMM